MNRRLWPRALPAIALAGLAFFFFILAGRTPPENRDATGGREEVVDEASSKDMTVDEAPTLNFPPLAAFDSVVERNLFSATRTAPRSVPENMSVTQQRRVELSLSGIVLSDQKRSAILMDSRSTQMMNIAVGESFQGWELVSLDAQSAVIRQGGEDLTLSLNFAPDETVGRQQNDRVRINGRVGSQPVAVVPRRGDGQGNPVPAARQSIDPDRLENRAVRH